MKREESTMSKAAHFSLDDGQRGKGEPKGRTNRRTGDMANIDLPEFQVRGECKKRDPRNREGNEEKRQRYT